MCGIHPPTASVVSGHRDRTSIGNHVLDKPIQSCMANGPPSQSDLLGYESDELAMNQEIVHKLMQKLAKKRGNFLLFSTSPHPSIKDYRIERKI